MGRLDKMVIASAFTGDLPAGFIGAPAALGATLDPTERAAHRRASITDRGVDFVAAGGGDALDHAGLARRRLEPRPFILRLFLARVGDGWTVMPGGFVRIADDVDARAVSLQQGGRTADAWVLSEKPVAETTLLPAPDRIAIQRATGALPSRAADNLFWLGRYVERAEATLRLVRALINRITEADEAAAPIIARISTLLGAWEAVPTDHAERQAGAGRIRRAPAARLDGSLPQLPSRRGAVGRLGDPRPLLARCLAGAHRSGRGDRCAAARPGRRKARCSSGSTRRCASSRRSPGSRRRT